MERKVDLEKKYLYLPMISRQRKNTNIFEMIKRFVYYIYYNNILFIE